MTTACYLTIGLGLSSPPIRRGCRAQKVWRYLHRIERLERYDTRKMIMVRALEVGGCIADTMGHLEAMDIEFDDYGRWRDCWGDLPRLAALHHEQGVWGEEP